jgi:hypothetical protein
LLYRKQKDDFESVPERLLARTPMENYENLLDRMKMVKLRGIPAGA